MSASGAFAEVIALLTAFGAAAVLAMMLCYAQEERSPWYTLGFAVSCLASSAYGWLAGTWPFGVVEAVWAYVAFRRWRSRLRAAAPDGEPRVSPGGGTLR